ncbi:MAG: hypothetical protein ACR2P0_01240, partial [Acidimicrobiales bacterium]
MTTTLTPTPTANDHNDPTEPTMTTITAPTPTTPTSTITPATKTTTAGKVTTRNVIHSEWIKFWSVRSTSVTLVAAGLATVMFGMIFSAVAESEGQTGPAAFLTNPVDVALGGVGLTEMIVGVLGVMVVASEYSTGLIRTSFAAVGRRGRVIRAKVAVLATSFFSVMAVAVTGAV